LPAEDRKMEEEERAQFEVAGMIWPHHAEVVEGAAGKERPADQAYDLKVRQLLVIEHPVVLPQPDERERSDEREEGRLESRKDRPESADPKHDRRAGSTQENELSFGHHRGAVKREALWETSENWVRLYEAGATRSPAASTRTGEGARI